MDIFSFIRQQTAASRGMFNEYIQLSRPILDFLHLIFDKLFYLLLYLAVIVSSIFIIMSVVSLFSKKKKHIANTEVSKDLPFVSVQIPTLNETVAIRCAEKCLEFDYPKNKFEILIGDDSTNPEISKKIDEFAKTSDQIIVTRRANNVGFKAGNLNNMLKKSKGEIIVVFDSDYVPEKDFLKRIVAPFKDAEVSAVQARWKFIDPNKNLISILGSNIISVFHHIFLPVVYGISQVSFLCGSAEAVRKKDLIELGEWRSGSLTEDIEFSLRILLNKKKIVYLDDLECAGEVPYKARDLYKQQMRWAYGVVDSFKVHCKSLVSNKTVKLSKRTFICFFCLGYLLSILLLMLFMTGTLSFVTHAPGPMDLPRFFSELVINVLLTSGIILASVVALFKTGNIKRIFSMFISSFSFGLIVTYYVNVGIFKVFLNRPMEWFMLNKQGNNA